MSFDISTKFFHEVLEQESQLQFLWIFWGYPWFLLDKQQSWFFVLLPFGFDQIDKGLSKEKDDLFERSEKRKTKTTKLFNKSIWAEQWMKLLWYWRERKKDGIWRTAQTNEIKDITREMYQMKQQSFLDRWVFAFSLVETCSYECCFRMVIEVFQNNNCERNWPFTRRWSMR